MCPGKRKLCRILLLSRPPDFTLNFDKLFFFFLQQSMEASPNGHLPALVFETEILPEGPQPEVALIPRQHTVGRTAKDPPPNKFFARVRFSTFHEEDNLESIL